jgi:hypothetical protein
MAAGVLLNPTRACGKRRGKDCFPKPRFASLATLRQTVNRGGKLRCAPIRSLVVHRNPARYRLRSILQPIT